MVSQNKGIFLKLYLIIIFSIFAFFRRHANEQTAGFPNQYSKTFEYNKIVQSHIGIGRQLTLHIARIKGIYFDSGNIHICSNFVTWVMPVRVDL